MKCGMVDELLVDFVEYGFLPPPPAELLLELELTEPSLFLSHAAGAPERLAAAIARRLA